MPSLSERVQVGERLRRLHSGQQALILYGRERQPDDADLHTRRSTRLSRSIGSFIRGVGWDEARASGRRPTIRGMMAV